jgi:phosphoglucomutase
MTAEGLEDYTLCMSMHPLAGQPAPVSVFFDLSKLITAYSSEKSDITVRKQRMAFGTS